MRIYNNKYIILHLEMIVAQRVIFHRISDILVLWLEPLLPVARYQSVKLLNQLLS